MKPYPARAVLIVTLASPLAACHESVLPTETETPAVCPEATSTAVAAPADSAAPLFALLAAPTLTADQEQRVAAIRSRRTTARVEIARFLDDPLPLLRSSQKITFNVSAAQSFTAVEKRLNVRAPDDISWSGSLVGNYGEVFLVLTSDRLVGSLQSIPIEGAAAVYSFEPIGDRLHAIVCVDTSKLPPD